MNNTNFADKANRLFNDLALMGIDCRVTVLLMIQDHPVNKELKKGTEVVDIQDTFPPWPYCGPYAEPLYSYTVKFKPH